MMKIQCPRCNREVDERFYGPCGECRIQLNIAANNLAGIRALVYYLARRVGK